MKQLQFTGETIRAKAAAPITIIIIIFPSGGFLMGKQTLELSYTAAFVYNNKNICFSLL
jgi:hypothetical protein